MTRSSRRRQQTRALGAARGLWGLICLLRPDEVARVAGSRPDRHATMFTRVLGGRELLQAAATAATPTVNVVRVGIAVDLTHALTMAALARTDPIRRRPALLNALAATGWALLAHLLRPITTPATRPAR